jgi:tetratricopeptide (TPR) repeat protein
MNTKKYLLTFGLSIQAFIPSTALATDINASSNGKSTTTLLAQFGVPQTTHQRQQADFWLRESWRQGNELATKREAHERNLRQQEIARVERIKQARESALESIPRLESKRDYVALLKAWGVLGEWKKSLDASEKAVEANPNSAAVYSLRASTKKHFNDVQGAIADYDRAIAIEADFHPYYLYRGLLKKSFDKSGAIQDFRMAIKVVRVDNRFNLISDSIVEFLVKEINALGATE